MNRIKALDNDLYKMIVKHSFCAHALGYFLNFRELRYKPFNMTPFLLQQIHEVISFLKIDLPTFIYLAQCWEQHIHTFPDFRNPQDFYLSWKDKVGAMAICANTINQTIPYTSIMRYIVGTSKPGPQIYADYGCGTGTFSLILKKVLPQYEMDFFDVPNLSSEFLQHCIKKHSYKDVVWNNVLDCDFAPDHYDLIVCFDVLEHLSESSQAMENLYRMLAKGGLLILRAPWGNHPEHIPEAAIDFYRGGGHRILKERFRMTHHFGHFHIHGVYRKVS
jgi:2-polyprenyl-3-methyl-5-hydroxy-6-metoxy-1,4-benzoquinol methylase